MAIQYDKEIAFKSALSDELSSHYCTLLTVLCAPKLHDKSLDIMVKYEKHGATYHECFNLLWYHQDKLLDAPAYSGKSLGTYLAYIN